MNYVIMPTCHWCHVMERESFEDQKVAEILNKHFVAIKVDREERPDVDSIYMSVCQMLTGSGGWPLSIFMDGDKKPFFAGTYFPKNNRGGHTGIISLLTQISELWSSSRQRLIKASKEILTELQSMEKEEQVKLDENVIHNALSYFTKSFDSQYGGFGNAPKFPTGHKLLFLLRAYYLTQKRELLSMTEKTLEGMAKGGIYDHIGFGFSRYSTDEKWLVPHFEKMLYDNALLSMVYSEAYHITKNETLRKTAREVYEYINRHMTRKDGTFYSAEDADSEGVEGKFYLWTPEEVEKLLAPDVGAGSQRFCQRYDISKPGNFEGASIPNLIGKELSHSDEDFFNSCRGKLFTEREKRIHPFKDTKLIVAWNGLMLASLAIGARIFGDAKYLSRAESCGENLYRHVAESDRLFAEDYAFFVWGLIELYQSTFKEKYLEKALELTELLLTEFWDQEAGGLFLYSENAEQLLVRPKEIYDGAMPSGNSVFAYNLIRLSRLTGRFEYEEKANKLLDFFSGQLVKTPGAYVFSLVSLLYLNADSKEVVIVAEDGEQAAEMLEVVRTSTNPFVVCLLKTKEHKSITKLAEFTAGHEAINGKPTAYVCGGTSCSPPVTEPEELKKLL